MITILIVDDELPIREWFQMLIIPLKDEFQLKICTAIDGTDGYEKYLYHKPEIVITDIKMPHSDGIELLKRIKNNNFDTYVIMLTSYDDFDYARKSLYNNADEYILKTELTNKIVRQSILNYKNLLAKKSNSKSEKYLQNYMLLSDEQEIYQKDTGVVGCLVIAYKNNHSTHNIIVLQPVDEIIKVQSREYNPEITIVLISLSTSELSPSAFKHINDYMESLVSIHGLSVSLSSYQKNITVAIEEALSTLQLSYYYKFPDIYIYKSNYNKIENTLIETKDKAIRKLYLHSTATLLKCFITDITELCRKNQYSNISFLKQHILDIIQVYKMTLIEVHSYDFEVIFHELRKNILAADKSFDVDNAIDKAIEILPEKVTYLSKSPYIKEIYEYISENYNSISGTSDIAEYLHLNSDYFCRLFKENFGNTFTDYLTDFKIQKSKILLTNTKLQINEIAVSIGYNNITYFARVFKKKVGKTPAEYRKSQ